MDQHGWPVTFSIGVLTCLIPLATSEDIIREVDRVMYNIKKTGKDTVHYETPTARLTAGLLNALESGRRLPPTLVGGLPLFTPRLQKPAENRLKPPLDGTSWLAPTAKQASKQAM